MAWKLFGKKNDKPDPDKDRQAFVNIIKRHSWDDTNKIIELITPAIEVVTTNAPILTQGESKFGGQPDLPPDIDWPKYKDAPMVFFAQINLADLGKYDIEKTLPASGIMYFFGHYKEPQNKFGAEFLFRMPKDEYKMLFYDGELGLLQSTPFHDELPKAYHFQQSKLSFQLRYTLPSAQYWQVEQVKLSEADIDQLWDFNETYGDLDGQILGAPYPIQYDVTWDWALSALGFDFEMTDAQKQEIEDLRPQYVNLLNFELAPCFKAIGDAKAFWGITKQDLKDKKFDKAVFILQDT